MTSAISTKQLGPTNHRGTRIKASVAGSTDCVVIPYDYALSRPANHAAAALALARTMGWPGDWAAGYSLDGWTFVKIGGCDGFTFIA